jgi:hypothetical protein
LSGPEIAGRHGYVYSIHKEGKGITASADPAPGEQLPALVNDICGPRAGVSQGSKREIGPYKISGVLGSTATFQFARSGFLNTVELAEL